MKLIKPLMQKQAAIVMQLCTRHIGLNKHLHHIKCLDSPHCPNCDKNAVETVHHFLFDCTQYSHGTPNFNFPQANIYIMISFIRPSKVPLKITLSPGLLTTYNMGKLREKLDVFLTS